MRQLESADVVEKSLREGFFEDESLSRLLLIPGLAGVALFVGALFIRNRFRSQSSHEERHGRRTKGPEWGSSKAERDGGIKLQLKPKFGLVSSSFQIPRKLESSHILLMGDTGSGKSNAIRQILRQVQKRGEAAIVAQGLEVPRDEVLQDKVVRTQVCYQTL